MILSRSATYGLRSALYLAVHTGKGSRHGVKTIAKELNFPEAFLGKVLQSLVRKGIISSTKGPNGGFFIPEKNLGMPLIRIIEAIDGLEFFNSCGLGLHECDDDKPCPIHNKYGALRDGLFDILSETTMADIKKDIEAGKSFIII